MTLRNAPGYESYFQAEFEQSFHQIALKLIEKFGHKNKYNHEEVKQTWRKHIEHEPSGQKKHLGFYASHPRQWFEYRGPQTGFEAQVGHSKTLGAPPSASGAQSSYSGPYQGSQTTYGHRPRDANPSSAINYPGAPPNVYHTFSMERPHPRQQHGAQHLSHGSSYLSTPDATQQSPLNAPFRPMLIQNYNQAGGSAIRPGMEEGVALPGAGYNTSHIQVSLHDRGAVANRGTLAQEQPMRSEGLASGGYDQNWYGGSENFENLSDQVPTITEMEACFKNMLHCYFEQGPDFEEFSSQVPTTMEMEDDFKKMFSNKWAG